MCRVLALCVASLVLAACASAPANLARLQAECSFAPLAEIGNSFIPVPGVGGVLNYTIGEVCAHTELVANDEAAIAAAVSAIIAKKR
jgi:hypothetical protein